MSAAPAWAALCPKPALRVAVELRARTSLELPGWLGSTLHGALGAALCVHDGVTDLARSSTRARWFDQAHATLPAWLASNEVPPLVLRPPPVTARRRVLSRGDSLHFELLLLLDDDASREAILDGAHALSAVDFGRRAQRVEVRSVRTESSDPVRRARATQESAVPAAGGPFVLSATTPLHLRHGGRLLAAPEPRDLALAALRRLASVRAAYEAVPAEQHLARLADAISAGVTVEGPNWTAFSERRYSSRQGRRHPVRGTLGGARFVGPTHELLALLQRAQPYGLGKNTALGLGGYQVAVDPS